MTDRLIKPCKPWPHARNRDGYGILWIGNGSGLAHRASWEAANGSIPTGLHVLHHCDNPPCTEITHLYLGTPADNSRDCVQRGRVSHLRGALNGRARLKPSEVVQLRNRYASGGVSLAELARDFGISKSQAFRIATKEQWSHV